MGRLVLKVSKSRNTTCLGSGVVVTHWAISGFNTSTILRIRSWNSWIHKSRSHKTWSAFGIGLWSWGRRSHGPSFGHGLTFGETISTFQHFGFRGLKSQETRNFRIPKVVKPEIHFRKRSWSYLVPMYRWRHMLGEFIVPMEFLWRTYGFVQKVPTGARRAISAQNLEWSKDWEVSGTC
jgi:hypothetical protein